MIETAYVEIKRTRELGTMGRKCRVFLNDHFVGALKRKQKMTIEVPAGTHTLFATNDASFTEPVKLSVQAGDTISYQLKGRRNKSLSFTKIIAF
ncbi:hypothetical protein CAY60_014920 [Shouchella clausii]|jgi:hypothetical protein|uniref:PEGA domain-containing protein n=3 Tax=Shouchella TaxID=2893057 RepID=Q5WDV7_SHOC1|nr:MULTISPECIES: hypothetical protein [Shouchella]MCM3313678.1 hypothetical protein [Psychrobacillus sp. MER TA 17]PAD41082.1 hypothetical protein CHH54_18925 [Bacillus sp. 7520-S]SPT80676.1 Uncharacterised protein [Niallia circulans]ALA54213.1 hypothetical protein DB29_03385 [Shouchella clausii]AST96882.1 hypothetical protein BC8716_13340 [Shouchella clausii]